MVTGSGTGMGRAIAECFAAEGAKVVVNYRASRDEAEEVAAGIGRNGGEAVAHATRGHDMLALRKSVGEQDRYCPSLRRRKMLLFLFSGAGSGLRDQSLRDG